MPIRAFPKDKPEPSDFLRLFPDLERIKDEVKEQDEWKDIQGTLSGLLEKLGTFVEKHQPKEGPGEGGAGLPVDPSAPAQGQGANNDTDADMPDQATFDLEGEDLEALQHAAKGGLAV